MQHSSIAFEYRHARKSRSELNATLTCPPPHLNQNGRRARLHSTLRVTAPKYQKDICGLCHRVVGQLPGERVCVRRNVLFLKNFKLIQGRCRSKFRTRVKVNSEYKDYLTLPAALLAQQGPVGPARPTTLAITAGRTSLPLSLRSIVPR